MGVHCTSKLWLRALNPNHVVLITHHDFRCTDNRRSCALTLSIHLSLHQQEAPMWFDSQSCLLIGAPKSCVHVSELTDIFQSCPRLKHISLTSLPSFPLSNITTFHGLTMSKHWYNEELLVKLNCEEKLKADIICTSASLY